MRIGIDVRSLAEGRKSGVKEYTIGLLRQIFEEDRENVYVLFYNSFQKQLPQALLELEKYPNVFLRNYHYPNKALNFTLWYFKRPLLDKLLKTEIFYSPNLIFTSVSEKCRYFITIHDLSFEECPYFFNFYRRFWHWLINPRKLARRANKVIAVSESTRRDLVNRYKIAENKIELIYPTLSQDFYPIKKESLAFRKVTRFYKLPSQYILTLATLEPRKNLDSVIKVYNELKKEKTIVSKLVIAGSEGWMFEKTKKLIEKSEFQSDIILIGEVEDRHRKYLYSGAELFIYPSFYEGFGFPPLEALACGTLVVCSALTSLPEIVGEAGLLVNPYDRKELKWCLKNALKDKKLKNYLREVGLRTAARFSSRKAGREFLKALLK